MFGFHAPELIVVLVIALLIFGPKKLPEMGASIGRSITEFRKGMSDVSHPKDKEEKDDAEKKTPSVDTIEREVSSKKEGNAIKSSLVGGDIMRESSSSEITRTESRVE